MDGLISRFAFLFLSTFTSTSLAAPIVIGFVGGFVAHDNAIHYEVRLATQLRTDYGSRVEVRMFANHRGDQALQQVLSLLDTDHDGALSAEEKSRAQIVIYGHSWGASEAIALARSLEREQIPVALTVQVDSVQKPFQDDASIPPNVLSAVNFFQAEGLLHGRAEIHAADRARTQILGNFRVAYKDKAVNCEGYSWFARTFMKQHIEIESDPAVWGQVDSLIREKLDLAPGTK